MDTPGPFGLVVGVGNMIFASQPEPGPAIVSGVPERRYGYAGELWLPVSANEWVLGNDAMNDEVVLTSETVTANASAVRIPTGPRFGYDHTLSAGNQRFDVDTSKARHRVIAGKYSASIHCTAVLGR
jgi:hypothetical protein